MPIIVNSKFNNLTYDEITQPLEKVTKAHNEVMEQYMQDASSVDMLANTLNPELDKEALAILQEHQAKNENAVNELMAKGLTPNTRALVLDLQKDANTRVSGVAMASATRQEIGKQQSQLLLQNPELMFRHKANELSLDTIMTNPNENYNEAIDLNKVSEEAAKLVTAMSQNDVKLYLEQGKYKNALPAIVEKLGWSYDEIQKKLNDPNNRNNAMNIALDEIRKQTGVDNWGDANAIANVQYAIKRGAEWAVGKTQKQLYQPKEKSGSKVDDYVSYLIENNLTEPIYNSQGKPMANTIKSKLDGQIYHKIGGAWNSGGDSANVAMARRQLYEKAGSEDYITSDSALHFKDNIKGYKIKADDVENFTEELNAQDKELLTGSYEDVKKEIIKRLEPKNGRNVQRISVPASLFQALCDGLTEGANANKFNAVENKGRGMIQWINTILSDRSNYGMNLDDYIISFNNYNGNDNDFMLQTKHDYNKMNTDYSAPKRQEIDEEEE